MLNLKKKLCLVKKQKREPSPSLLVGIGLITAHIIRGSIRGRVGFTQKLVSAPTILNSRTDVKTEFFFVRCIRTYIFLINGRKVDIRAFYYKSNNLINHISIFIINVLCMKNLLSKSISIINFFLI